MKNFIQKTFAAALIALPIFGAGPVWAWSCGGGKITNINEGDANSSNFLVKIDYSKEASMHPGTEYVGHIRFQPNVITQARLDAIKKLILASYFSDQPVYIYSHNNDCGNATQVVITR